VRDVPPRLKAALADRYRIEREIGAGGMATVYLAEDLKHHRQVAVKVLRPELAVTLGHERFLREISITARLDHPGILPLLDSGQSDIFLYYVMPFVDGESLRDRMVRDRQMPLDEALRITGEVAGALGYAHAHGVIHRDIKPDNILLSDGHARVADFGIARAVDLAGGEKLTDSGQAVGTAEYMSPEQSMAETALDGRSDLYSLGCVLFEMLAGEVPYDGPTARAIIAKRLNQPVPSVRTLRETVPEGLDAVITKSLAKAPADRFASATEFVEALKRPVSPHRMAQDRRWITAGVVALPLIAGSAWLLARARRPPVESSISVIAVIPATSSGDTALARLGRDLVLTVSAGLDGVGGIRTIDPQMVLSRTNDSPHGQSQSEAVALGKGLGAGSVVTGNIVRTGTEVRLDLKLISTGGDSAPLARVTVQNGPDSIGALTDSITWAVLRQVWRHGEPPSPSYADLTTRSLQSLRAFLDGERLSVAGRWPEASDAYAAAIQADSSFWLAGWRYNSTREWIDGEMDTMLARKYGAHLSAFGGRDRALIEAEIAGNSETEERYLARVRTIAERFPDDWAATFKYADELYHAAPLTGHTNAEARRALQRLLDLNPKLLALWDHLAQASAGHDSAQCDRAVKAMIALGGFAPDDWKVDFDPSLFYRILPTGGGSGSQLDTLAAGVNGTREFLPRVLGDWLLLLTGFPAAQLDLNRRRIALDPRGFGIEWVWKTSAIAWAIRGAWDSSMVAFDTHVQLSPDQPAAVEAYRLAVVGAWFGGLDTAQATARRVAAVKALERLSPQDTTLVRDNRASLAWADGMLAILRLDPQGLTVARKTIQESKAEGFEFLDRSLAGHALQLKGATNAAADSLEALDLGAGANENFDTRDPLARSINHLTASRLLLQRGDTSRAVGLLYWHEANMGPREDAAWFQMFAPIAYFELARIEEAQGRDDLARDHYQQFLRRYDRPAPVHQQQVADAKAALRRLAGQRDPGVPR
jgi:serine/threonine protein kinase